MKSDQPHYIVLEGMHWEYTGAHRIFCWRDVGSAPDNLQRRFNSIAQGWSTVPLVVQPTSRKTAPARRR